MAVSLTASTALGIQARLNRMWNAESTSAKLQYDDPTSTLVRMLSKQTVRILPVLNNAGQCVDVKIWWTDLSDINASEVEINDLGTPGCDVASGPTIGTTSKTYTPNAPILRTFQVSDDLCSNDVDFQTLAADGLAMRILQYRKALNQEALRFLNTNLQNNTNTSPGFPDFVVSSGGALTTISAASYNDASILMKLKITADINRIPSYSIYDGMSLLLNKELAPFLGQNDDNRATGSLYDQVGRNYNADPLNMYSVTGADSLFLVNNNMVGYFNMSKYGEVPVALDTSRSQIAFSIEDPVLKYQRNVVNDRGVLVSTSMEPVRYDIVYQKVCESDRDANHYRTSMHRWEVLHNGGFVLGPEGDNGETGILKFVKDSGI